MSARQAAMASLIIIRLTVNGDDPRAGLTNDS
jgi:hypothetical protein